MENGLELESKSSSEQENDFFFLKVANETQENGTHSPICSAYSICMHEWTGANRTDSLNN